jgi:hypothetical protein
VDVQDRRRLAVEPPPRVGAQRPAPQHRDEVIVVPRRLPPGAVDVHGEAAQVPQQDLALGIVRAGEDDAAAPIVGGDAAPLARPGGVMEISGSQANGSHAACR